MPRCALVGSLLLTGSMTLLAGSALTGCFSYNARGPWYSGNAPLTFESTAFKPKTLSLIDTRTGETIWSVDVPVGKELVVKFREGVNEGELMADLMEWGILDSGARRGELESSIPAPPRDYRRLDMTIRAHPESAQ